MAREDIRELVRRRREGMGYQGFPVETDGELAHALLLLRGRDDVGRWGGYAEEVEWDFFLDHVVVAGLDPGKDDAAPVLTIYDRARLVGAAVMAADEADPAGHDDDVMEELLDAFGDLLDGCEAECFDATIYPE